MFKLKDTRAMLNGVFTILLESFVSEFTSELWIDEQLLGFYFNTCQCFAAIATE